MANIASTTIGKRKAQSPCPNTPVNKICVPPDARFTEAYIAVKKVCVTPEAPATNTDIAVKQNMSNLHRCKTTNASHMQPRPQTPASIWKEVAPHLNLHRCEKSLYPTGSAVNQIGPDGCRVPNIDRKVAGRLSKLTTQRKDRMKNPQCMPAQHW